MGRTGQLWMLRASRVKNCRGIYTLFCVTRRHDVLRRGACHLSGYGSRHCGVGRSRLGRLLGLVAELGLSGRVLAGCEDPGSVLFVRLVGVVRGRKVCVQCAPWSSAPSSHKASHFPRSRGMPHSASTIIGNNISFVAESRNSGRVYRLGSVGMSRSLGGHGGAGSGFW
jgi:hypothetical protein